MPTANTTLTDVMGAVLLFAATAALAAVGYRHFQNGLAEDAAVPIPVYMISHQSAPKAAYVEAAVALGRADPANGTAAIARAEASIRSGRQGREVINAIEAALTRAPASSRGWTLLSEVLYPADKKFAARALGQALILAPKEYWLMGPQILDAARLWPFLDSDARSLTMAKAKLMWSEELLHPHLRTVLDVPEGRALMTRSLSANDIRALNRWLIKEYSEEIRHER